MASFFPTTEEQDRHYRRVISGRRPTTKLFSCGYHERFDPFMLERKPFLAEVYEKIFAEWFPRPVEAVLDIGCGTGLYWPILQRHCQTITGIDASPAMLEEAHRLVQKMGWRNVNLVQYDGHSLSYPDESFDVVLCMDVLHHIPDLNGVLPQLHRVLKLGGRLVALEPNVMNPLIFIAHLIPAEERHAITRNFAPRLRQFLSPYFDEIEFRYDFLVMSIETEIQLRMVSRVGTWLSDIFPPFRHLGFRLNLSARRRSDVRPRSGV